MQLMKALWLKLSISSKEYYKVIAFRSSYLSYPWTRPLSHLLKQLKGFAADNDRNINITHNFFVNDFKLYVGTTNNVKNLLDIVPTVSKDTDMKFGVDKCAYIKINVRKQTNSKVPL